MNIHLIELLRTEVRAASQSGWAKALCIVVLTDREGMTAAEISEAVNVPGFSTPVVRQHLDAVELAIEAGLLPHREDITLETVAPDDAFDGYYVSIGRDTRYNIPDKQAITELAEQEGVGVTKALDIAKNPRALGIAFRGSEKAQEAVFAALEHVPDSVLERLTVRAYAVMTDRQDADHRVRSAHLHEVAGLLSHPHIHRIHPDYAVVVNGSVFVFNNKWEAERFKAAYQEVHGRPATPLSDVIVTRDEAWASLREFREAQVGRSLDTVEWKEYLDSLV